MKSEESLHSAKNPLASMETCSPNSGFSVRSMRLLSDAVVVRIESYLLEHSIELLQGEELDRHPASPLLLT